MIVEETNKIRIDQHMIYETTQAICPNCGYTVYPKRVDHFPNRDSNMRWCNHCYVGKARIFWRYIK